MEFFLEMLLTVVVALLLSFPLAKLVSAVTSGNVGGGIDSPSDQSPSHEIGGSVTEELRVGVKMEVAPVVKSERSFKIVDENVEIVDRFVNEADGVDQVQVASKGELSADLTPEADSAAVISSRNVIAEEKILDEGRYSAEKINREIGAEREELLVRTIDAESKVVFSPENMIMDERKDSAEEIDGGFSSKRDELMVPTIKAESTAAVSPEIVIAEEMILDERRDSVEEIDGRFSSKREELMVQTIEAESTAALFTENVIAEEMILDERRNSAEEIGPEREELMFQTTEAENVVMVEERIVQEQEQRNESIERRSDCLEDEESRDVLLGKSEEFQEDKEKQELIIEEEDDDGWEGIERSELEKAFTAAAKAFEESGKAQEMSADAQMELYGLHKIATEGSCRETQPMAVMVTSRAKWNAWQRLGNMSQEEAMEQYLALISKEIPGFITYTAGEMPKMETSVVLPHNSVSVEDPTTTTGIESSKMVQSKFP